MDKVMPEPEMAVQVEHGIFGDLARKFGPRIAQIILQFLLKNVGMQQRMAKAHAAAQDSPIGLDMIRHFAAVVMRDNKAAIMGAINLELDVVYEQVVVELDIPMPSAPPDQQAQAQAQGQGQPQDDDLRNLKALAERLRGVADDKPAAVRMADEAKRDNPGNHDIGLLCDAVRTSREGDAIRDLCDGVKARTH